MDLIVSVSKSLQLLHYSRVSLCIFLCWFLYFLYSCYTKICFCVCVCERVKYVSKKSWIQTLAANLLVPPEDHSLHMTGFLWQLRHDKIFSTTCNREAHHAVPYWQPVGPAHKLVTWMVRLVVSQFHPFHLIGLSGLLYPRLCRRSHYISVIKDLSALVMLMLLLLLFWFLFWLPHPKHPEDKDDDKDIEGEDEQDDDEEEEGDVDVMRIRMRMRIWLLKYLMNALQGCFISYILYTFSIKANWTCLLNKMLMSSEKKNCVISYGLLCRLCQWRCMKLCFHNNLWMMYNLAVSRTTCFCNKSKWTYHACWKC